ncbi:DUF6382 domain-containing protein [Paenibacillus harenae]|uniref:FHA domain-containing protein n=1 Tax=Paenibacillus harenae TaxID=306543 RepID=A0ABT9TW77_PAEHA|nr:DUF6382 domain-containing protein [Paenibacillus harenae]MDQ0111146.1 hypothetical protein [Paenibacillus harenae]
MHNFRIDFSMNRGHEMLIDTEEGINRSSLDDIELHMLRGEKIPYLLPVDWFELDGKVTFRYALDGHKMLLHRLQLEPLTMQQYYTLVLGLTDALSECRHYMLRPEGCLLNESFIFIGEQLHDVRLAYVPIKASETEAGTSSNELMSLIVRWTSNVDMLDGEGLKRLLRQLSSNKWPLVELRSTLLELIGGMTPVMVETVESNHASAWSASMSAAPKSMPVVIRSLQDGPLESVLPIPPLASERAISKLNDEEEELTAQQQSANAGRSKWIGAAVLLLATACIWRFVYLVSPSKQTMLISAAMTLMLVAGFIFVWRRNSQISKPIQSTILNQDHELAYSRLSAASEDIIESINPDQQIQQNRYSLKFSANEDDRQTYHNEASGGVDFQQVMKSVDNETSLIENRATPGIEPTVLLAKPMKEKKVELTAKLYRRWQGETRVIEWLEPNLRIGRAGEQIGYEELASGVSRMHLEFESLQGERVVKDLGSSNGSTLNGEPMIPYKAYKITAGDVIQLAGAKGPIYELRLE